MVILRLSHAELLQECDPQDRRMPCGVAAMQRVMLSIRVVSNGMDNACAPGVSDRPVSCFTWPHGG